MRYFLLLILLLNVLPVFSQDHWSVLLTRLDDDFDEAIEYLESIDAEESRFELTTSFLKHRSWSDNELEEICSFVEEFDNQKFRFELYTLLLKQPGIGEKTYDRMIRDSDELSRWEYRHELYALLVRKQLSEALLRDVLKEATDLKGGSQVDIFTTALHNSAFAAYRESTILPKIASVKRERNRFVLYETYLDVKGHDLDLMATMNEVVPHLHRYEYIVDLADKAYTLAPVPMAHIRKDLKKHPHLAPLIVPASKSCDAPGSFEVVIDLSAVDAPARVKERIIGQVVEFSDLKAGELASFLSSIEFIENDQASANILMKVLKKEGLAAKERLMIVETASDTVSSDRSKMKLYMEAVKQGDWNHEFYTLLDSLSNDYSKAKVLQFVVSNVTMDEEQIGRYFDFCSQIKSEHERFRLLNTLARRQKITPPLEPRFEELISEFSKHHYKRQLQAALRQH